MSRTRTRFLIGQHVALNTLQSDKDCVEIICTDPTVYQTVNEAKENARFVSPVQLIRPKELGFAYVLEHLSHIAAEELVPSGRGVLCANAEENFPHINVVVVEGREDITIKIFDEGGGIPRSAIPLI